MTLQEIMLKLKEASLQNNESPVSQEDLKKQELVYKRLMSLKVAEVTKKAYSLEDEKERFTMLFFSRAIDGLRKQYLMDERKDIISLYVTCTGHEEISEIYYVLISSNELRFSYLEQLCNEEGIKVDTSNDDGISLIWFEVNILGLSAEKQRTKYTSLR